MKLDFLKDKKTLLYIGYPTTTLVSFLGYSSQCKTFSDYAIIFLSTIVLQAGAFIFTSLACNSKDNKFRNTAMAIVLVAISIMFSLNLNLQFYTRNNNEVIQNSAQYKHEQQRATNIEQRIFDINKDKIDSLSEIDLNIADLEKEKKSALAKNWITTPVGSPRRGADVITEDIKNERLKKQSIRDKASAEIAALNESSNVNITMSAGDIQSDKGLNPTVNFFAKVTNKDTHLIGLLLFSLLTIATELTIIFTHVAVAQESSNSAMGRATEIKQPTVKQFKPKQFKVKQPAQREKPKVVNLRKQGNINPRKTKTIGFNMNNTKQTFNKQDIEEYTKAMYKFREGNKSAGYKHIANNTSLSQNKCREIKKYLQETGVIETKGNTTYILE